MRTEVMCSASSGDLPINITWTKDGGPIKEIEGVRVNDERSQFSSILTITDVSPRHSGNYTCQIGNAGGLVSRSASLSVTGKTNIRPGFLFFQFYDKRALIVVGP